MAIHAPFVVEKGLAHTIRGQVEAAYRRGDLFTKRAELMADGAVFCLGDPKMKAAVLPLRSKTVA